MFRNSIEFIADGVEICWRTAVKTIDAAKIIKTKGHHGLSLSLSVLAMEEIGKLTLLDGLIFSKPNDERSVIFEKGFRSHKSKLFALDIYPFLINYLASFDDRFNEEQTFNLTLAVLITQYKQERQLLAKWIGSGCDLKKLDEWKQKGFYTHYGTGGQFNSPSDIDVDFSNAVYQLSNRIVDGVDFLLKSNIGKYKNRIKTVREKVSERQLLEIRKQAEKLISEAFEIEEDNEPVSG